MKANLFSDIKAQRLPNKDEEKHENEYAALLALFKQLIVDIYENGGRWKSLESLMSERADLAIRHAFDGFGLTYEEACNILKKADDLTDEERVQRDILVAAVDNLVDFSVAEEYQLADESVDLLEDMELELDDGDGELDEDALSELYALCKKYNHQYAWVEDMDIEYAMIMAAYLSKIKSDVTLMYMTMGDERVRPWHLQYEGFTAPKSSFPGWLIPPIEHGCRCYLVEDTSSIVSQIQDSKSSVPEMPDWFDGTFKESVSQGGRIFSDEHPYFQIKPEHKDVLREIARRIKIRYLNGTEKSR